MSDLGWKFDVRDEGSDITVTGTIYTTSEVEDVFYYNPVYQTEDGEVYAVSGTGEYYGTSSGSIKLAEEYTQTLDGEKKVSHSVVEIEHRPIEKPVSVSILQINESHKVLNAVSFETDMLTDELPEQFDVLPDTDYILVETRSENGVNRNIFQKTDECLHAFCPGKDGICIKKECRINWN